MPESIHESIAIKPSSITSGAAIPITAIAADHRNYKFAVLKQLEALAFDRPVAELVFTDLNYNGIMWLVKMSETYNLTFYVKCKKQPLSVHVVKNKRLLLPTQD